MGVYDRGDGAKVVTDKQGRIITNVGGKGTLSPEDMAALKTKVSSIRSVLDSTSEGTTERADLESAWQKYSQRLQEATLADIEAGETLVGPTVLPSGEIDDFMGDPCAPEMPLRTFDHTTATDDYETTLCAVGACIDSNSPVLLWGPPGVGKTSVVEAYSEANGMGMVTLLGATSDPTVVAGIPFATADGRSTKVLPDWAQEIFDNPDQPHVVFCDEFSNSPPAVRAALLSIVSQREVAGQELPAGTRFVAAANETDSAADGWELDPATENRWVHVEFEPTPDASIQDRRKGFRQIPLARVPGKRVREKYLETAPVITEFLAAQPDMVHKQPEDATRRGAGHAWPSQRSWDRVGVIHSTALAEGHSEATIRKLIVGAVGPDAGTRYMAYYGEHGGLPSTQSLYESPTSWSPPKGSPDKVRAAAQSMITSTVKEPSKEKVVATFQFLEHLGAEGYADVAASSDIGGEMLSKTPREMWADPDVMRHLSAFAERMKTVAGVRK